MIMHRRLLTLLIPVVAAVFFCTGESRALPQEERDIVRVVEVHDGDTVSVVIGKSRERVRLIGIDAPEMGQKPWGGHAKRHLKEILNRSEMLVTAEFDVERRDKFGRLLAYLWTTDRKMVNLQMIRDGYAVLLTVPPNVRHVDSFREGQRFAREKGLGIWGKDGLKETPGEYKREHPRLP